MAVVRAKILIWQEARAACLIDLVLTRLSQFCHPPKNEPADAHRD